MRHNTLLNCRMNTKKCFSAIIYFVHFVSINIHFVRHRTLNILRSLSEWNRLSGSFNIFMSIIYMFPQIAPLNASIVTVRAFVRFFARMNSNMFPQCVKLSEFLFTELAWKWFITSVHLHMNSQSSCRFEAFGTLSTYEVKFSRVNFLSMFSNIIDPNIEILLPILIH